MGAVPEWRAMLSIIRMVLAVWAGRYAMQPPRPATDDERRPSRAPSRTARPRRRRGAGIVVASGGEPLFHLIGFLACAGATAARACKSVLQSVLMSHSTEKLDSMVGGARYQKPTPKPCLGFPHAACVSDA